MRNQKHAQKRVKVQTFCRSSRYRTRPRASPQLASPLASLAGGEAGGACARQPGSTPARQHDSVVGVGVAGGVPGDRQHASPHPASQRAGAWPVTRTSMRRALHSLLTG